ncbi:DNA (cytosine-5-)-methyltransferase [Cytobacillus massiliigabonensis]|uniref:DNA (cytosine-5-)-methyltransferase n=1 Tax=Cytobacillus massiliigabonensis TaxID=1871011 RepID=UPI000C819249|nr:DNA (cytosine-5-)-methyltransferase [Cytobacillus massiliigabonensis]
MIKHFSFFTGIGAFEKAMTNVKLPYEVVGYSDYEDFKSRAFSLIHGVDESLNYGDITKIDAKTLPDFDLMTWGFPCTDISIAKEDRKGLEGEESGLYYDGIEILRTKRPKYSIIENVSDLVKLGLDIVLRDLEDAGYINYWRVLNCDDYGIPQDRKRVFVVSIRKDVDSGTFKFPEHTPSTIAWYEFIDPLDTRPLTPRQTRVIDECKRGVLQRKIEGEVNFDCAVVWDRTSGLRFRSKRTFPTITARFGTGGGNFPMLAYKGHIGGISPRSCFKLMGFTDEDFDKVDGKFAQGKLYVMAGDSIPVNVLEGIFENLKEQFAVK